MRFPLGSLGQDETRALAQRFGLAVADKKDSQDICFVPQASKGCGRRRRSPARSSTAAAEPLYVTPVYP